MKGLSNVSHDPALTGSLIKQHETVFEHLVKCTNNRKYKCNNNVKLLVLFFMFIKPNPNDDTK